MSITSLQNARIKHLVKLNNRRHRDAHQHTLVEGIREISRALANHVIPQEAYICPPLLSDETNRHIVPTLQQLAHTKATHLFEVTPAVFAKIAYRGQSGGILLVIPYLHHHLADLPRHTPPFLAVVENIEKPGNLGAILRTADAAGVDGVIVCTSTANSTDIHNPNVIRASLGTIFTVPVVATTTQAAIAWLQQEQIAIIVATPEAGTRYTAVDLTTPTALVTGSEADGLSPVWLAAAQHQVSIPMVGAADSLNVATATALLLYEVVRQRHLRGNTP